LSTALDSIREATQQNLHGIKQLEEAASGMKSLSEKLKSVSELFKA
jgi:methyl-accepting chemotaxis protein